MTSQDLRNKIHRYIDIIEDEEELQLLSEAAEVYATNQQESIDTLTFQQKERLEASIKQADIGNLIPHDEVKKLSRQWLTK